MHDGSVIRLHKLAKDWNPLDRIFGNGSRDAKCEIEKRNSNRTFVYEPDTEDLHDLLDTSETPFNTVNRKRALSRARKFCSDINDSFR